MLHVSGTLAALSSPGPPTACRLLQSACSSLKGPRSHALGYVTRALIRAVNFASSGARAPRAHRWQRFTHLSCRRLNPGFACNGMTLGIWRARLHDDRGKPSSPIAEKSFPRASSTNLQADPSRSRWLLCLTPGVCPLRVRSTIPPRDTGDASTPLPQILQAVAVRVLFPEAYERVAVLVSERAVAHGLLEIGIALERTSAAAGVR